MSSSRDEQPEPTGSRAVRQKGTAPIEDTNVPDTTAAWTPRLGFESETHFKAWRDKVLKEVVVEWVVWSSHYKKLHVQEPLASWDDFWKYISENFKILRDEPKNLYSLGNLEFSGRLALRLYDHFTSSQSRLHLDLYASAGCVQPRLPKDIAASPRLSIYRVWQFIKFINKETTGTRSLSIGKYKPEQLESYMTAWNWRPDQHEIGTPDYLAQHSKQVPGTVQQQDTAQKSLSLQDQIGMSSSTTQQNQPDTTATKSNTKKMTANVGEHGPSNPDSNLSSNKRPAGSQDQTTRTQNPHADAEGHTVYVTWEEAPEELTPEERSKSSDMNRLPTYMSLIEFIESEFDLKRLGFAVDLLFEPGVDEEPDQRIAGQGAWDLVRGRWASERDGWRFSWIRFATVEATPMDGLLPKDGPGHQFTAAMALNRQRDAHQDGLISDTVHTEKFVRRTRAETIRLLELCASFVHRQERVNQPPDRERSEIAEQRALTALATLARESTAGMESALGEHQDAFESADNERNEDVHSTNRSIEGTFRTVQVLMDNEKLQLRDVREARRNLIRWVGTSEPDSIVYRLPPPPDLSPEAFDDSALVYQTRLGDRHQGHQVLFLAWAVYMERLFGGGICSDAPGLGKTHEYMSLIIAANRHHENLRSADDPPIGPTLIVCPHSLRAQILNEVKRGLGAEYQVEAILNKSWYNNHDERIVKGPNARYRVFVTTYTQLSLVVPREQYSGLFFRIILDEAQAISRSHDTRNGEVLNNFQAKQRWSFTATVAHDSLANLQGFAVFHSRPWWGDPNEELNTRGGLATTRHAIKFTQWQKGMEALRREANEDVDEGESTESEEWMSTDGMRETQDWWPICPSEAERDPVNQRALKYQTDHFCHHFPALIETNMGRLPSMASDDRPPPITFYRSRQSRSTSKKQAMDRPFAENPYDLYHKSNLNKLRCWSLESIRYWIFNHLPKAGSPGNLKKVAQRVSILFEILILARNHSSTYIDEDGTERRCGTYVTDSGEEVELPPMEVFTQDLTQPTDVQLFHDRVESEMYGDPQYEEGLPSTEGDEITGDVVEEKSATRSRHRIRVLMAFNVALYAVRKAKPKVLREWSNLGLRRYVERLRQYGGYPEGMPTIRDDEELLRQALWPSVTLRDLLGFVYRVCFTEDKPEDKRKVLIFFKYYASMDNAEIVLNFLGIKTAKLSAQQTPEQRANLVTKFNTLRGDDASIALLACYSTLPAGFSLHHACCSVYHAENGDNVSTEFQAAARSRRLGQTATQEARRRMVENTYCEEQEARMLRKHAPLIESMGAADKASRIYGCKVTAYQLAMVAMGIWRIRAATKEQGQSYKSYAESLGGIQITMPGGEHESDDL